MRIVATLITVFLVALLSPVARALGSDADPPAGSQGVAAPAARPTGQVTSFVTRSGTQLLLDGAPFRFAGANLYWTGLDENVGGIDPSTPGTVAYPSFFRIRDGLTAAKTLGASVVRAHTVGVSTGNPDSMEPGLGADNAQAWASMDYTVAEAGRLGLRLIVPLTDNWQYYHGGRYDFLRWLGLSSDDHGEAFYTDSRAVAAYQDYVRRLLDHVNPLTGLRYADDPTIMAWELGNELDYVTQDWVDENADVVKQLAPRQLVAAGRSYGADPLVLDSPSVDIADAHYYPLDLSRVDQDAAATVAAGKVFVIGEYASTGVSDSDLQSLAGDSRVSGAAVWSLFPHADHYGFVQHDDGYTLHVPGDTPQMQATVAALTRFGVAMGGPLPPVTPEAPLVTAVSDPSGSPPTVTWRGVSGAAAYQVTRTSPGVPTLVSAPIDATASSWTLPDSVTGLARYAVAALDPSGRVLSTSRRTDVAPGTQVTVDPLEDWYLTSDHTSTLVRSASGTTVAISPPTGQSASITWYVHDLRSAGFLVAAPSRPQTVVQVLVDDSWHQLTPTVTPGAGRTWNVTVTGLSDVAALRIIWDGSQPSFALRRATWSTP